MKPRELAKIRVPSAPPGKDKDTPATQKPVPAAAQVQEPAVAAPTAGQDVPTIAIDLDYMYVYQG